MAWRGVTCAAGSDKDYSMPLMNTGHGVGLASSLELHIGQPSRYIVADAGVFPVLHGPWETLGLRDSHDHCDPVSPDVMDMGPGSSWVLYCM